MNKPEVSVVVITYNRKELLKETIVSIINQTYTDFELLVIDNYSEYDFFGFIEELNDKRIKPYQNHNHGVIATNRNLGIQKATGSFISFCDDDDMWEPEKLEKQLQAFEQNPDILLVSTRKKSLCKDKLKRGKIKEDIIVSFES